MTHTKGPWKEWHGDIVADGDAASDFDDYVIAGIGKSYGSRSSAYSPVKITTLEGKANARRVAACVNALDQFDIAAIEGGVVREIVAALKVSQTAINDWLHSYAEEMCNADDVKQSVSRIGEHGTLHYIATVQAKNREALTKIGGAL